MGCVFGRGGEEGGEGDEAARGSLSEAGPLLLLPPLLLVLVMMVMRGEQRGCNSRDASLVPAFRLSSVEWILNKDRLCKEDNE